MKFQVLTVVMEFPGLSITEPDIAKSRAAGVFQTHRILIVPADGQGHFLLPKRHGDVIGAVFLKYIDLDNLDTENIFPGPDTQICL